MTAERNAEVARQILDSAFNQKDIAAVRALLAPDYVEHRFMPGQPDSDFWGYAVATLRTAIPDYQFTMHRVVSDDEGAMVYGSGSGTHRGTQAGIPGTHRSVTWPEVHIMRLADGLLKEHWVVADNLELLTQLGIIPAADTPLANTMNTVVGAGIRLGNLLKRRR